MTFRVVLRGLILFLLGAVLLMGVNGQASAANSPPAASAQSVGLSRSSGSVGITLSGTDQEGDSLTYTIVTQPSHGTLSGTPPNVVYTWTSGAYVNDSFTFKVNDGTYDSPAATVSIEVFENIAYSNMPATPHYKFYQTPSGTAIDIVLSASDFDGDPITYSIVKGFDNFTCTGSPPNLTCTPDAGFTGSNILYFNVRDNDSIPYRKCEAAPVYCYVGTPSSSNLDPVCDAGPDLTGTCGESVELDGSRCFDPCGSELTYLWSCSAGTFGDSSAAKTTFTCDTPGTYECTLYVTNSAGLYDYDYVCVDFEDEESTPAYDTLSVMLMALFCAFIGMRYVRRAGESKRSSS